MTNGQCVTVIRGDDKGKTGRVVRVRISDNGAWVCLDSTPAKPIFPSDDGRHYDVMLYPEDVEEVKEK